MSAFQVPTVLDIVPPESKASKTSAQVVYLEGNHSEQELAINNSSTCKEKRGYVIKLVTAVVTALQELC